MKEIIFNPANQPVEVQINMGGIVFVKYHLLYFSAVKVEKRVLIEESGNNIQPHTDSFELIDPLNVGEPVSNTNDRIILFEVSIFGLQPTESPFEISLEFFQIDTATSSRVSIGTSDKIKGSKKLSNTPKAASVVVKFKSQS
jgi:hypothetical protein